MKQHVSDNPSGVRVRNYLVAVIFIGWKGQKSEILTGIALLYTLRNRCDVTVCSLCVISLLSVYELSAHCVGSLCVSVAEIAKSHLMGLPIKFIAKH